MNTLGKMLLLAALLVSAPCCAIDPKPSGAHGADTAAMANPRIVLYSAAWCPHCKAARDYFSARNIPFELLDVDEDADALDTLFNRYRTNKVPLIVIGDDAAILNGFDPEAVEQALQSLQRP